MDKLVLFNRSNINKLLNKRTGESKFGQYVQVLPSISNIYENLKDLDVKYVIFGLPEDVGVFANYGKIGTSKAWDATIKVLLNIQSNEYTMPESVLILGHLDFSEEMEKVSKLDQSKKKHLVKARELVGRIDTQVAYLVEQIVTAGKTPIIIGGGHNNAYGNIKGASLALKKPINAINFDAHSDFRQEEGRHSGNGFSYAYNEGFLNNYFIFGLHKNYTSDKILKSLNKLENIAYNTYEDLEVTKELKFKKELNRASDFISESPYGIEIDCDAIENINSSAKSPSGFSTNKTRQFINFFAAHNNAKYLHICEAAPTSKTASLIGKLITYLITDFIRANNN
ncbi:formimidoylglutamase [Gaetbulibacter saemankumensis]|uniref:formimidoylglutamase n=1 Tax=Gaetbulibacter saemankumensis TaxID=311208 RepID=UPI00041A5483|nr:formimidoylglutamase [Gaetbulibacter saemankumensis]